MAPTQKEKFIAVAQEFLDNHQRLFDLYYVQGTITKEEHDQLHGLN